MMILGTQYEMGSPLPLDYEKAAYWYGKAAESGSVNAMFSLAKLYQKETPASLPPFQDIAKAIYWYEAGAAKGDPYCMLLLARIYDSDSPSRDVVKAIYWYSLLASDTKDFHNAYVMRRLGELYATAPEVKNDGQSFDWYEKAALWFDKGAKVYMCSLPPDIGDDRYVRARQVCNGLDATKVASDEDSAIAMLTSDRPNETAALPILIRAMWQGGQRSTVYLGQYVLGTHGTPFEAHEAARQIGFAGSENCPRPKAWMAEHGDIAQMVTADELDLASLPAGYVVLSPANDGTRYQVPLVEGLRDILVSAPDEIDGYDLEEGIDISVSLACQWGDNGWLSACTLLSETPRYSRFGDTATYNLVHQMRQVLPLESWRSTSAGKWSVIRVHVPVRSH
jgi:TPR repeat protein